MNFVILYVLENSFDWYVSYCVFICSFCFSLVNNTNLSSFVIIHWTPEYLSYSCYQNRVDYMTINKTVIFNKVHYVKHRKKIGVITIGMSIIFKKCHWIRFINFEEAIIIDCNKGKTWLSIMANLYQVRDSSFREEPLVVAFYYPLYCCKTSFSKQMIRFMCHTTFRRY